MEQSTAGPQPEPSDYVRTFIDSIINDPSVLGAVGAGRMMYAQARRDGGGVLSAMSMERLAKAEFERRQAIERTELRQRGADFLADHQAGAGTFAAAEDFADVAGGV